MIFVTPFRLFGMILLFSLSALAQEEGLGERFPEGVSEAEYQYRQANGGEVEEARIDPPFWWVGMKNPTLQLLIHAENIGGCDVNLSYPGLEIKAIHRVQNPNYLFLDLWIGPGARAGKFRIELACTDNNRNQVFEYELKNRDPEPGRTQGVTANDLIYLIMPDRFANGNPGNDSFQDMEQTGIDRENVFFRHGGDLIGIMEHLDYLEELGVTALWLNPILENDQPYDSYHGYALTDHYKVDPRFGTNEQYLQLVRMCHERGIKVIMDIIHNHVGDQHWFIRDLPTEDWIHQFDEFTKAIFRAPPRMDPYASRADNELVNDGWFDNHMPDLNQKNPLLANYLIQNNIWWAEFSGHDAYRIDTYVYCDQDFMAEWGKRMQEEFKDFNFFGETWVHGIGVQAQFTQDNHLREGYNSHLPAVTDYQMYYAVMEGLQQDPGWTDGIARVYYTLAQDFLYEDPYCNVLFLDNHDLGRLFAVLQQDMNKFKSGLAMIMTLRGVPLIYYGTEVLMEGVGGAFGEAGRRDFPGGWKGDKVNKFKKQGRTEQEQEAFEYVKTLANYRKNTPALQQGQLMQFVPENGIYTYFRYDSDKTIMVAFNANDKPVSNIPVERYRERTLGFTKGKDIFTGKLHPLGQLSLDRKSILVLELQP